MRAFANFVTAALLTMTAGAAFAASPAGSPADPNSPQNRQPGPSATTPTDPAAGGNPAARVPTAPSEQPGMDDSASDGAGSGESGLSSPAGNAVDPNSVENRQPAPSPITPTDPEAGSNPDARAPTAPNE